MNGIPLSRRYRFQRAIEKLPNLVIYYPLNEITGSIAKNCAPVNRGSVNGNISGVTLGQPGKLGRAYSFNGVSDKVTYTAPVTTLGQKLSIFCVFKTTNPGSLSRVIIGGRTGSTANKIWKLGFTNSGTGRPEFNLDSTGGGGIITLSNSYNDGLSHFIVGTYDGSNIRLYIDGIEVGTPLTGKTTVFVNTTDGSIGCRNDTSAEFYNGLIQHCGIIVGDYLTGSKVYKLAKIGGFL